MDTVSKAKRSEIMSKIKSKNTGPERILRAALASNQLKGFTCHVQKLPGKPDFAYLKKKIAIFVEGCFFHGCPAHYKAPKSNRAFWATKIKRNIARDALNQSALAVSGYRVLRFWECEVRKNLDFVMVRTEMAYYGN